MPRRRNPPFATAGVVALLLGLALAAGAADAHPHDYPPPPPEAGPEFEPPPPPPAAEPYAPAVRPRRRKPRPRRYRPSPWGRFYVGGGVGYFRPSGGMQTRYRSALAYNAWVGWRKRWLGFELGYLGATLRPRETSVLGGWSASTGTGAIPELTYASESARLSHITADAKLFLQLWCKISLFGRIGLNYTQLRPEFGDKSSGYGYQMGAGMDYRIRLTRRPNLVLKLRAEMLYLGSRLQNDYVDGNMQGMYLLFNVNLGWSP